MKNLIDFDFLRSEGIEDNYELKLFSITMFDNHYFNDFLFDKIEYQDFNIDSLSIKDRDLICRYLYY